MRAAAPILAAVLVLSALAACRQDMHDQPKYEAYERSTLFEDGRAMRPQVPGTVARGRLHADEHLLLGRVGGELADTYPFPVTREVLERGRERYDIYCAVCHGPGGDADGVVVQRGFARPASFHEQRLVDQPPGYFVDVIANGFGRMYSYEDRVPAPDRWAIAAYVRVLQTSRSATLADVPTEARAELEAAR